MTTRYYSDLTIKRLFLLCGHFCAYPGCTNRVWENGDPEIVILGQVAHIEGSSDTGPRPNPTLTKLERNDYQNLVVLCAHHHTLVDKIDSRYPKEELLAWKSAAESATQDRLSAGISNVTFTELGLVCGAFLDGVMGVPSSPMIAIPPGVKMAANGLTDALNPWMSTGLAQAGTVGDYIGRQAQINPRFPERLRAGFLAEYDAMRQAGIAGDDLFLGLVDYGTSAVATPQTSIQKLFIIRTAALAVLCHLFEICDIFEAPE